MKDGLTAFHERNRISCHRLEIVNYDVSLKEGKRSLNRLEWNESTVREVSV